MTPEEILRRAEELIEAHRLSGWSVRLDGARRRAGCCYHQRHLISLSKPLLTLYPPAAVDEVILHEVAHALVGAHHQHDQVWKEKAASVGATPKATMSKVLPRVEAAWVGVCPGCAARRELHRAPRQVTSCAVCSKTFDVRYVFQWTHHGRPAVPPGQYAKKLQALKRRKWLKIR